MVWLERMLLAIGVVCLGWYGYHSVEAANFQREQTAAFERTMAQTRASESELMTPAAPAAPSRYLPPPALSTSANLIGMLDIPRLRLSTPVMAGDDDTTLDVAVGHLPDTPRPWEPGNSAIAAHRDGLFRPLKDIRVGDALSMRTPRGNIQYKVREIKIVTPDDLSVLEPTGTQTLTLITCYPFYYVGSAPKRFIVHAERVETP